MRSDKYMSHCNTLATPFLATHTATRLQGDTRVLGYVAECHHYFDSVSENVYSITVKRNHTHAQFLKNCCLRRS